VQEEEVETPLRQEEAPSMEIEDDEPAVSSTAPGASRLNLLAPGESFSANSPADPFAQLKSSSTFASKDKLEWVAQYCAATSSVPNVEVLIGISGPFGGSGPDRVTPPKKMKPTRLASSPGCYALRGASPLSKMPPGRYLIRVMFEDLGTFESYDLERQFVIQ
jgi:hypothetical protein